MAKRSKSPYPNTKQYKGYSSAQDKKSSKKTAALICRLFGCIMLFGVIICLLPATFPRIAGYELYHVESGSMEPEIPVGSAAYIKSKAPADVNLNDVIAFMSGNTVIIHRVVEIDADSREFTTKGDANPIEDISKVSYDNYIGVVALHLPGLGAFMAWCLGIPGRFIMLAIAVAGTALILLSGRLKNG